MAKNLHFKLVFVLLILSRNTQAQTYHPLLGNFNEWDVYVNMIPLVANNTESAVLNLPYQSGAVTTSDTVINSTAYKTVYSITDPNNWGMGHPRFIREDTAAHKVYLLSADSLNERILYDFSMAVGDSVYLSWEYQSPNVAFNNGYYTLDSTGTIATGVGMRAIYYLTSLANQSQPFQPLILEWIESIGSTISPVYLDEDFGYGLPNYFVPGCYKYYLALTCAYTDSVQTYRDSCMSVFYNFYISNMNDSCIYNLTGGLNDYKYSDLAMQVAPNPFSNSTHLKISGRNLNQYKNLNLKIFNAIGVEVKSIIVDAVNFENGVTLFKDNLKAGIYTVQILDNGKVMCVTKLVVE